MSHFDERRRACRGAAISASGPTRESRAIVDTLNRAVTAGIADPAIKARFAELGDTPLPLTPAAFGQLIADETEKWAKVIHAAKIKPE